MHEDVKRIRFHLMGLAIIVVTLLQLLLIAFNRVAIVENEWNRLENYAWNVKVKIIDYDVKDDRTIISIDRNKADMMQSEANGLSLGLRQSKETYNEKLFNELDAGGKKKILEGKFVRKTSVDGNQHVFTLYQPWYSLKGDVSGIIGARDCSGSYDDLFGEMILNLFKVDFTAVLISGIALAVHVQKKRARIRKFQYLQ